MKLLLYEFGFEEFEKQFEENNLIDINKWKFIKDKKILQNNYKMTQDDATLFINLCRYYFFLNDKPIPEPEPQRN